MTSPIDDLKKKGESLHSEKVVKKKFLDYFQKNKDNLSIGHKIETLYEWLIQGQLSKVDKAIVIGALLYFINPLDAIPDLTPFVGFGDDIGVALLVYRYLQNRALENKNK